MSPSSLSIIEPLTGAGAPGAILVKCAILMALWLAIAGLRKRASAAWLVAWWRAGVVALLVLSAAGLLPAKWHFLPAKAAPIPLPMPGAAEIAAAGSDRASQSVTPIEGRRWNVPLAGWLLAVWGLGAVVVLGRSMGGSLRIRRWLRAVAPVTDHAWLADAEREARDLGLRRMPLMLVSREAQVPFATGWLRPAIVLPADFARRRATQRLAILRHELAHIAHRDIAWQWLATLAAALHWPNPLAWLARRQLLLAHESAADDSVLATGADRIAYAALLSSVARQRRQLPAFAGVATMARPSTLGRRVTRLLAGSQSRAPAGRAFRAAVTLGGISTAFALGIAGIRADEKPATDPAPSPKPAVSTWARTHRDTFQLQPAFAERFNGSADEALAAFRREISAAGIKIPDDVKFDLHPDMNALSVEFTKPGSDSAAWGLNRFLANSGWWKSSREATLAARQAAIELDLAPLVAETEDQRIRVNEAYAEMSKIRERDNIIDPDPESFMSEVSFADRDLLALERDRNEQRMLVTKHEGQHAQILRMQPMELREALRTLEIEDRDVNRMFDKLADATDTEGELVGEGALDTDPRLQKARDRKAAFLRIFAETLASLQRSQSVRLEIQRRNLKEFEARLAKAMQQSIADKQKISGYVDAKSRYLQVKKIFEAAEIKLETERLERAAGR